MLQKVILMFLLVFLRISNNSDESGSDSENEESHSSTDEDDEKIEFSSGIKTSEHKPRMNNPMISSTAKDAVEKMDIDTTDEDAGVFSFHFLCWAVSKGNDPVLNMSSAVEYKHLYESNVPVLKSGTRV